jgi:PilZ domain
MTSSPPLSARSNDRRRQLKAGIIAYNNRHSTLPCSVRDISDTGARLEVAAANVPDTFELIVELDGIEVPCAVAWRKVNFVGVKFTAMPVRVEPKRSQVVQAVGPNTAPSLRRKLR